MYDIRVICLLIVVAAASWLVYMFITLWRGTRPPPRWPGDP